MSDLDVLPAAAESSLMSPEGRRRVATTGVWTNPCSIDATNDTPLERKSLCHNSWAGAHSLQSWVASIYTRSHPNRVSWYTLESGEHQCV